MRFTLLKEAPMWGITVMAGASGASGHRQYADWSDDTFARALIETLPDPMV